MKFLGAPVAPPWKYAALPLWLALIAPWAWSATAQARPDDPGSDAFTFDVGDQVLTLDSPRFRFHYTVLGTHAIPVADSDASGVPDHLEELVDIYESALDLYLQLGYRPPVSDDNQGDNGGDGRFDVYLLDFAFTADGAYRNESCLASICAGRQPRAFSWGAGGLRRRTGSGDGRGHRGVGQRTLRPFAL